MNGYWIFKENERQKKSSQYIFNGNWGSEVQFNEIEYRADSIYDEGFKVMSLGCSMTYGDGLYYDETWPKLFANKIPNGVNLNFGLSGLSNDRIVRNLIKYYDLVKPDLVIIMWTGPSRRECWVDGTGYEDHTYQPYKNINFLPYFNTNNITEETIFKLLVDLSNEWEDNTNWYKNYLLAKYFLKANDANWVFLNYSLFEFPNPTDENFIDIKYDNLDMARDGGHPGPISAKVFADKLFYEILNRFPNYLPKKII